MALAAYFGQPQKVAIGKRAKFTLAYSGKRKGSRFLGSFPEVPCASTYGDDWADALEMAEKALRGALSPDQLLVIHHRPCGEGR